jgi:hypothetical protein
MTKVEAKARRKTKARRKEKARNKNRYNDILNKFT